MGFHIPSNSACGKIGTGQSAGDDISFFKGKERACFLGDSITHEGAYLYHILLFEALRRPETPFTVFNAGSSGGNTGDALKRLEKDVISKKTDCVMILLGMNDTGKHLYQSSPASHIADARRRVMKNYENNMAAIIKSLMDRGRQVILMTPTPFDEYSAMDAPNDPGRNESGLSEFAQIIRRQAELNHLKLIDFHKELTELIKADPSGKFTRDRVHPQARGHLVMAAVFLKSVGESSVAASIAIDARTGTLKTEKAIVKAMRIADHEIIFEYTPRVLPYPVDAVYLEADRIYPVTETLNKEILCVGNLRKGTYRLEIAGKRTGIYSASEFETGINMALLDTPSASAAGKLQTITGQINEIERRQCGMALLKRGILKDTAYQNPAGEYAVLDSYLESIRTKPWHPYYSTLIEQYKTDRPKEAEFDRQLKHLFRLLHQKRREITYTVRITKNTGDSAGEF